MKKRSFGQFLVSGLVLVLLLSSGLIGCSQGQSPAPSGPSGAQGEGPKASLEPYKLGVLADLTGTSGASGTVVREAFEMVAEEINKSGGIDGHPLKLVIYDSKSDPTEANRLAKKLLTEDKVVAAFAGAQSSTALAAIPVFEETGVVLWGIGGSDGLTLPKEQRRFAFSTMTPSRLIVPHLMEFSKKQGWTKVAILASADAFGDDLLRRAPGELQKADFKLVITEKMGKEDPDVTPQLARIKNAKPDVLWVACMLPGGAVVAKNAQQMGFNLPLLQIVANATPEYIKMAGPGAEGTYVEALKVIVADTLSNEDPSKTPALKHRDNYRAKYNKDAGIFTASAEDALRITAKALDEVGPDPKKLRDYIENMQHFGINAVYKFSPDNHIGMTAESQSIAQVKGGKFVYVK